MINQSSFDALAAAQLNAAFRKPLYDSYCFSRIPQTIQYVLGAAPTPGLPTDTLGPLDGTYDVVILFFIDALGWRFVEPYLDEFPFFKRIVAEGVVSKLTSQFPSTTAAHVTAIHTGLPVGSSGIYEWFYYEPTLDRLIAPLLFSYAGDKQRETLVADQVDPASIFPTQTIYHQLARHGVSSFLFQAREYARSPYTSAISGGATVVPYGSLAEALVGITQTVARQREKTYIFFYYDQIDSSSHRFGPTSPQVAAEIQLFLMAAERLLHRQLASSGKRLLFLLTADHGQIEVAPTTTIYLNQALPALTPMLRTNRAGVPLVPAGAPRDMFLYIKDEYLDAAEALLRTALAGRAEVWRVSELLERGLFGAPSAALLARLGNLVLLPYAGESVWWYERGRHEQKFYGAHGGLTPQELETVLLAYQP